jgi:iron complex transport system permease protein
VSLASKFGVLAAQSSLLAMCMLMSVLSGSFDIGFRDMATIIGAWLGRNELGELGRAAFVLEHIRLPRIIFAALAGANLAVSGAIMQNVLKNPLADPYVLGLSSSAAFGAALCIVLGTGISVKTVSVSQSYMIAFNAFACSMASLVLVMAIVRLNGYGSLMILLSGIAVSGLFAAGLSLLKYFSASEALKDLDTWLMGGFWGANYSSITALFSVSVACWAVIYRLSWKLNAIAVGDEVAVSLGVNVRLVSAAAVTLATLLVAGTIAFSGVIGFVGLVCPYISRGLVGTDNRFLLPSSMLTGGILLTLADLAGRNIISPAELPVGIVTAVIGTPVFLYMLAQRRLTA